MASFSLPNDFRTSLVKSSNYPVNLPRKGMATYRSALEAYKKRLDEIERDLCLVEGRDEIDKDFEVIFRDLATGSGKELEKRNIHSPAEVLKWLGVDLMANAANINNQIVSAKKRDPKSRFIYIYAENSRDQLKITRTSLVQILTFHGVMPAYLDFMMVFGAQSDARDLRFSGFREQITMQDPSRALAIPDLGRSGKQFDLCYCLKGVVSKRTDDDNIKLSEWSIRQAAIYHQFDVVFGTSLWIVTKGRLDIQQRYKELTGSDGRPEDKSFETLSECFRSTLSAHLLFCLWSTEDWRWYIRWLEDVVDCESSLAVYGPRGPGYAHREYKPFHIQELQYWQEKTNEAVMVMQSNVDVIMALRRFYVNLAERSDFPDSLQIQCRDDLRSFKTHIDEVINDFNMQISRARLLANIIGDRKELVLQHLQGQTAERTEQLNLNLEREAVVMRIITLVTLLYLPATFVSTFFSTDVIKFQADGTKIPGPGSFSSTAMNKWLQVTLPLTALTFFIAWTTYRLTDPARRRTAAKSIAKNDFQPLISPHPDNGTRDTQSRWNSFPSKFHDSRYHKMARKAWKTSPALPLHRKSPQDVT